jgi:hypothetical protein
VLGLVSRTRPGSRGARILRVAAAALAALAAAEPPADAPPESLSPRALRGARLGDLAFLGGAWYSGAGADASWQMVSCPAGERMLGIQEDVADGRSRFFEFQEYAQRGEYVVFLASPLGRAPTPFVAVETGAGRAVFENAHHDFPQRIVLWLEGDELVGRIEGEQNGEPRQSEWRWRRTSSASALLAHCPAAP